ncbi:MAG: aspartate/glutamate racemase family protein [Chloracidobacterium sp.]|nr:aspartate/glutamate racemase family protein [Chloracidobacterium sp.]
MKRLGIIDWGIGGISIVKLIKKQLGDVPVIYFSDTGVTPYGKMSRTELVSRLNVVITFLKSQGVSHLIIGCNAASTVIANLDNHGIEIEGVIEHAIAETVKLKPKRLGLIGGRRTVCSAIYRKAFAHHKITVNQRIAQPLSGLIESGDVSSGILRAECNRILKPLGNCSHILLACTHYPAIIPVMKDFVGGDVVFIDPVPALANVVRKWNVQLRGDDKYLTTGDPKTMKNAAAAAFGWHIENTEKIKL